MSAPFPLPTSLIRSAYQGHQASALARLRTLLPTIDLVLEVRDYRLPLTTRNPLLEDVLLHTAPHHRGYPRARIIVFTKKDLGCVDPHAQATRQHEARLTRFLTGDYAGSMETASSDDSTRSDRSVTSTTVLYTTLPASIRNLTPAGQAAAHRDTNSILSHIASHANRHFRLAGTRVLVAGMPNTGKSTLLNALRAAGSQRGKSGRSAKVAHTGGQPGVTRKVGGAVRILSGAEVMAGGTGPSQRRNQHLNDDVSSQREGVFLLDTPGISPPYTPSPLSVLHLALIGTLKDGLVAPVTLVHYLLHRLNALNPTLYFHLLPADVQCPQTDPHTFLYNVARRLGRLERGKRVDLEGMAASVIRLWRRGELGRFVLDDVDEDSLSKEAKKTFEAKAGGDLGVPVSATQAKKAMKAARVARQAQRNRRENNTP